MERRGVRRARRPHPPPKLFLWWGISEKYPACIDTRIKSSDTITMAQEKISKNARRTGAAELTSRWGGKIVMKSLFENGRMRHYAECQQTGKTARRPRDLM